MHLRLISPVLMLCLALAAPAEAKSKRSWPAASAPAPAVPLAPPANDNCAGAILIGCGNILLSGNTGEAANDYSFADTVLSCTGYASYGRDVVYKFNVGAGDSLWLDYRNVADGSIYLVTDCNNVDGTCVIGADQSDEPNAVESIRYRFQNAGIYYLILDSYGLNTSGPWTANGQLVCGPQTPPSNDLCENATPLPCGTFNLNGSTQYATNNYGPTIFSCTGYPAEGKEVAYRMNITAGDSLWVNYTSSANGSVYIVSDCDDVYNTCVWGEDQNVEGQVEELRYRFAFSGVYYLVFDSRNAGSGTWNANGALVCVNPPPPNNRCEDSAPVGCGEFSWSGTTAFATNDYFFPVDSSCTGYPADGRDIAYRFDALQGDSLRVTYRSVSQDGTLYIVTDCSNLYGSCLVGRDLTVTSEFETLSVIFPTTGTYYLILDSVDPNTFSTWTATGRFGCRLADVGAGGGTALSISSASPNPFSGRTRLSFQAPVRGRATLRIYDLQGRAMRTLLDGEVEAGHHHLMWDGRADDGHRLEAGVYFARLALGGQDAVRRMIFVR